VEEQKVNRARKRKKGMYNQQKKYKKAHPRCPILPAIRLQSQRSRATKTLGRIFTR
jgi:hypothetical protein